jgi:hypothetical protein
MWLIDKKADSEEPKKVTVAISINTAWSTLMKDDRLKNIKSDIPDKTRMMEVLQASLRQFQGIPQNP